MWGNWQNIAIFLQHVDKLTRNVTSELLFSRFFFWVTTFAGKLLSLIFPLKKMLTTIQIQIWYQRRETGTKRNKQKKAKRKKKEKN